MPLDLVIRGGTVATAEKTFRADVGMVALFFGATCG